MDSFNLVNGPSMNAALNSVNSYPTRTVERSAGAVQPLSTRPLESESCFYARYPWSLNVFPKLGDVVKYLRSELGHLKNAREEWQQREVEINIFLFCCAISESVDDFLLGKGWDFSKVGNVPLLDSTLKCVETLSRRGRQIRERYLKRFHGWRTAWDHALHKFICECLTQKPGDARRSSLREIEALLAISLPDALLNSRPRIPAAFHAQDLTHLDIVTLGDKFAAGYPDRKRPVLIVGLRTAGSYFVPVLHAHLLAQGYSDVSSVTIRPKIGVGHWEGLCLKRAARKGAITIVIDEPGGTGSTYARGVECVCRTGIPRDNVVVLVPVHPTVRDWREKPGYQRLSRVQMLSLEPEEYYKNTLMQSEYAEKLLSEYFRALGYSKARIVAGPRSAQINKYLRDLSEEKSQNRFKCVYEVELLTVGGERELRFVIAKSVGWGWLSYHAFSASEHLSGFVPPVLGLRDGLLYSEWWAPQESLSASTTRERLLETAASYIAQRVRKLPITDDPTADLADEGRHFGSEKFVEYLSRAYGGRAIAGLRRGRIRHELARQRVPCATFIDGRMRRLEWIEGRGYLFKSDFEQHGLGKYEHSFIDPARDLADVILNFGLSIEEEQQLINRYVSASGDADVQRRLFLNKVEAGTWAMSWALSNLNDTRLANRHGEFHERFTEAWDFLTIHIARRFGSLCQRPQHISWRTPIVVLDIDGVLDKPVFGVHSTTWAGIQAVSLLHNHGFTLAIDTARTIDEVKEYCRAYGCAGGVAEYGAWAWDAVTGNETVLVTSEDLEQLDELALQLREIPGVFLNDGYRYSLHAYTYDANGTVPLPRPLIETLMSRLKLDRLRVRQTAMDTTVVVRHTDKGRGLLALKTLAGLEDAETVAVGDTESDLPMFAVSQRSFAPGNMRSCRPIAKSMGCKVVSGEYQVGLLQIAQAIVHPDGKRCSHCQTSSEVQGVAEQDLLLNVLKVADESRWSRLFGALFDPMSIQAFHK